MAEAYTHTPAASLAAAGKSRGQLQPPAGDSSVEDTIEDLRRRNAELTEENAHLAEAVVARDVFLAAAAHELRNPMTPIAGRVHLLRRMMRKPDVQLEKVEENLEQVEWLIDQFIKRATTLLDVSRVTSGKLQLSLVPVDVCVVAREVAQSFWPVAEQARSPIELDLPDEATIVAGDRLALEQILDNLVSNAIKYGAGKPILMRVIADTARGVASLSVRDGGPGISQADQARIFERFERAVQPGEHRGGFGVGLWIVRQLTEAMAGRIEVSCRPGAGSTFCVILPLPQPKEPE
jgi:two-component system, OmpR family, sensor kinase